MTPVDLDVLRREIADGCRVLAARDLAPGILGHISVPIGADRLLIRCRGPRERGLAYTTPGDIRLVDRAGAPGADGELDGKITPADKTRLADYSKVRAEAIAEAKAGGSAAGLRCCA